MIIILLKFVFWLSLAILLYSYVGYGLLLWLLLKIRGRSGNKNTEPVTTATAPEVTLMVATYNEAPIIETKIENSFALDYPADKLQIIFVADGSDDGTPEIISRYPRIKLYYQPERQGKTAAINRVMPLITTPITIFCDANTTLNTSCIREIVKHFQDENVGAVAGEKKVLDMHKDGTVAGAGEGLYWKYESKLKKLDSEFYSVVGAAGELFSVRTSLFEPVGKDILLDDFMISMKICRRGYRVVYEPAAYATEAASYSIKEEQKRKIRIAAGGFQSILLLKDLLNIFKYGKLSFQYISHRVLRWLICPILLPLVFLCNVGIMLLNPGLLYKITLVTQVIFYLMAIAGSLFALQNKKVKLLYIPYYFTFMNLAMYLGFSRFVKKNQSVLWEKARRQSNP